MAELPVTSHSQLSSYRSWSWIYKWHQASLQTQVLRCLQSLDTNLAPSASGMDKHSKEGMLLSEHLGGKVHTHWAGQRLRACAALLLCLRRRHGWMEDWLLPIETLFLIHRDMQQQHQNYSKQIALKLLGSRTVEPRTPKKGGTQVPYIILTFKRTFYGLTLLVS